MGTYIKATESEILFALTKAADEKGVVLTYAHKIFFLRLLDFAEKKGSCSADGLSVTLSVQGLSEVLNIPLRTAIQSLNRLASCGAVLRIDGRKTFPRSPSKTIICKKIYEKEN